MSETFTEANATNTATPTTTILNQMAIIEGAVQAVLDNMTAIEASKEKTAKIEGGQLGILQDALKDYPEPMTETMWDEVFKDKIIALLAKAKVNGKPRYETPQSRYTMTNNFKAAPMGLTLAKENPAFLPSSFSKSNLKKYADEVRPKLQADIDPATNAARLKKDPPKERIKSRRVFDDGTNYWLIGLMDPEGDLAGAQILTGDPNFENIESYVKGMKGTYPRFSVLVAKMEDITPKEEKPVMPKTAFANSAVMKAWVAPSREEA